MSVPKHYHGWIKCWSGRGLKMFTVKRTGADIKRQRLRGRKVVVRRWWRTHQACANAMKLAGVRGHIRECDLGDDCPEALDVLAN